jgi:hypothetical protein
MLCVLLSFMAAGIDGDFITAPGTLVLAGTVAVSSTSTLVVQVNGVPVATTQLTSSDTSWTATKVFAVGSFSITVTVESVAGNINSTSRVLSIGKALRCVRACQCIRMWALYGSHMRYGVCGVCACLWFAVLPSSPPTLSEVRPDTGISSGDWITNSSALIIVGTASAYNNITLTDTRHGACFV